MAASSAKGVVQQLRRAVLRRDGGGLTDGQLLQSFVDRRDEAAFETLVLRHGPMVLGVCRRVLGNPHDAADAFQATFLVLIRKAESVLPRDLVGNWLYGVAYQTALKARALVVRRQTRERQVLTLPETAARVQEDWSDVQPVLDQELNQLPGRYRIPILLCDVQGMTRKEAAQRLGWPEGTLSSRLARARGRLAQRLTRRGVILSGSSLATVVSQQTATAHLPASLVSLTVQGASLVMGKLATVGVLSGPVVALTEGVIHGMLLTKIKVATAVILVAATLGVGGSGVLSRSSGAGPQTGVPGGKQPEQKQTPDQDGKRAEDAAIQFLLRPDKNARTVETYPVLQDLDSALLKAIAQQQLAADEQKLKSRAIQLGLEAMAAQETQDLQKQLLLKDAELLLSLSRKEDENALLKKKLADLEKKVATMEKTNQILHDRVEELHKKLGQLKQSMTSERNPATKVQDVYHSLDNLLSETRTADLRGQVLRVADGLAVISKGSDQGVQVGQKLHLYSNGPQPTYLGEIEILKTEPGQAVGRTQPGKQVQPGDRVTSQRARSR